jgi:hypothetical protein
MLPMRDGVKLHTEYDLPLFHTPGSRIPAVLERSPYGANAEELIADVFGEALGYVSVRQDMRGTKQSEGSFAIWHDSRDDAFDTMDWIVAQPWSNGIVFTTGASADGIDELAQISGPHPALRGQLNIFATRCAGRAGRAGRPGGGAGDNGTGATPPCSPPPPPPPQRWLGDLLPRRRLPRGADRWLAALHGPDAVQGVRPARARQ